MPGRTPLRADRQAIATDPRPALLIVAPPGSGKTSLAAERFGFTYEGLFRQHMIVKGRNRDTAWFAMLDSEWPARRMAFETWLSAENFDADGRQRASLGELMGAGGL